MNQFHKCAPKIYGDRLRQFVILIAHLIALRFEKAKESKMRN